MAITFSLLMLERRNVLPVDFSDGYQLSTSTTSTCAP
ncbi:hypothetical protein CCACVL1_20769 [Corchorus capsularis]|uniref:Uncharacterized protein n=1 Tax=Corchorus capsularis TaxID=210143 RepID=A0A1R3H9U5_COCAP|nr:hypothetical protein CCACVL1_20769 [Corchorus capsularis]